MAKKKKLTKAERKEARLRKGKQWLFTYTGSPKKMNKHYRERFHVDAVTAAKDLQELGVNYTQEQLDQIKRAEEQRLRQRRMEREAKERERLAELYEDCKVLRLWTIKYDLLHLRTIVLGCFLLNCDNR